MHGQLCVLVYNNSAEQYIGQKVSLVRYRLKNMNSILFFPILLQGLFVIFSYLLLYRNNDKYTEYFAGLTGSMFIAWAMSVALTVVSYFLLLYVFVWKCEAETCYILNMSHSDTMIWILCIYTVFLGSAAQYAGYTVNDVTRDSKSGLLAINLWTTGIASLLISFTTFLLNGIDEIWYYQMRVDMAINR